MDLFWLKFIHTLIAVVNATAVFYILYCGLRDRRGLWLNIALVILAIELVSLGLFGGNCPLQLYARQLEGSDGYAPDLFAPDWVALNLVPFFTPVTLIAVGLVIRNDLRRRKRTRAAK